MRVSRRASGTSPTTPGAAARASPAPGSRRAHPWALHASKRAHDGLGVKTGRPGGRNNAPSNRNSYGQLLVDLAGGRRAVRAGGGRAMCGRTGGQGGADNTSRRCHGCGLPGSQSRSSHQGGHISCRCRSVVEARGGASEKPGVREEAPKALSWTKLRFSGSVF